MFYDFNPRHQANHVERRYLGTPGSCNIMLGNDPEDPKYAGPCGAAYKAYSECLVRREFNRVECRGAEEEVIACEQARLGDQSKQLSVLASWRKNKGTAVRSSFVGIKFFDE